MPLLTRRRLLLLIPGGLAAGLLLPVPADEVVLLTALCRGLFFLDGDSRPDDLALGAAAAARIQALPSPARWQLRGDLHRIELSVAVLIGARLSAAPPAEARQALQHLRAGRRGAALARLQEVCALACYGHPAIQAELGYDGPPP